MTRRLRTLLALCAVGLVAGWLDSVAPRMGPTHLTGTPACQPAPAAARRAAADFARDITTGHLAAADRLISPTLIRALRGAARRDPTGRVRLLDVTVSGSLSCPRVPALVDVVVTLTQPSGRQPVVVAWTLRLAGTPGGWRVTGVTP